MTTATIKIDLYEILSERIEPAVQHALMRATKHVEWSHWESDQARNQLAEKVVEEVLGAICEVVQFDDITADLDVES